MNLSWIPCSPAEVELLRLNPRVPWPADQIKHLAPHVCAASVWQLVERYGWSEARKCPEVWRLTRLLTPERRQSVSDWLVQEAERQTDLSVGATDGFHRFGP